MTLDASGFIDVGTVDPKTLLDARLGLHWAAQVVAAGGTTLAQAQQDYSHTNLEWISELRALAGAVIGEGRRAALLPGSKEIAVLDGAKISSRFPLSGRSLSEALAWLAEQLGAEGLSRPEHDMPSHVVADEGRFETGSAERDGAIAAWFDASDRLLRSVEKSEAHAAPVRLWPHHFDIATLIALDPETSGDEARTIGVGMTPGDGSYAEPYLYVTPWPYPKTQALPPLDGGGSWHTTGWTGALLLGSSIVSVPAEGRSASVAAFAASAISACRSLLAADDN